MQDAQQSPQESPDQSMKRYKPMKKYRLNPGYWAYQDSERVRTMLPVLTKAKR